MVIRALAMRDLPGLVRMRHGGVRLDLPETLLGAYTPLKGVAQGRWSLLRRPRVRTYVAAAGGAPVAFIQTRDRPGGQKWDILHLGAVSEATGAGTRRAELWTALLDYTTAAAGRRGVQRLYAKLPDGAEAGDAFHAAGYAQYGEETVYLLQGRPGADTAWPDADVADAGLALRPQTPGDTWALHQLYTWTTPKPVQHAEAHTSQHWDLPLRGLRGEREWGFVVERGHEIVLYCRVDRQGRRSRLAFVFDPQRRDVLGPTIDAMLRWLAPEPDERVYCTVREFQGELGSALETRGFEPQGLQSLLVRYTTVSLRALTQQAWPTLEKVRAGARVPVHLLGRRKVRPADPRTPREEQGGTPVVTPMPRAASRLPIPRQPPPDSAATPPVFAPDTQPTPSW